MTSIEGDRFEIAGGQIATNNGHNPNIKASERASSRITASQDAVDLAKELGIDVSDSPSPSMQWELRTVGNFTGNTFDRAYAGLEVRDHHQDIKETATRSLMAAMLTSDRTPRVTSRFSSSTWRSPSKPSQTVGSW